MVKTVDAALFQRMVIHGAATINYLKQPINDLNVFPVPDGDTGTNMSLTISAAGQEMKKKQYDSVGAAARAPLPPSSGAPGATPASSCPCCSAASPRR